MKRIISQPSLSNIQPPAPKTPSKFQFQIIDLPDPHEPALQEFQVQVLGEFGNSLTPTQIVALRCYHPALRQYDKVYFSTVEKSQYIVVSTTSLNKAVTNPRPLPLKIGGYQIHSFPDIFTPCDRIIFPRTDLINTAIDPQRPIEPEIAAILKRYFTYSAGVRLLVFGHLVILFPDVKNLQWTKSRTNLPLNIGTLTYSFDVLTIMPSSLSTTSGSTPPPQYFHLASTSRSHHTAPIVEDTDADTYNTIDPHIYSRTAPINDQYNTIGSETASCALGVKVHIPERDVVAWTSPTHAWVPTADQKRSWMAPLTDVVRRLAFWKKSGREKATAQSGMAGADPLGKVIYYEGTREVVGTVTHIYDSPPMRLPYPQGYQHDLALITGPDLPKFSQPPNCAKLLTEFATPEEALKAGIVFLLMSDFRRSKPGTQSVVTGHIVPPLARDTLIMGSQTFWNYNEHLEITNSLIWRSDPDDKQVSGASGSLLCLGSNADGVTKGLVFQNFEDGYPGQSLQTVDKRHEKISGFSLGATFKGGFFLPSEVQAGRIILDDQEETRIFSGKGPELSPRMHVEQKRNFTE